MAAQGMAPSAVIAQLLARREQPCELPGTGGATVTVRRPAEAELPGLRLLPPHQIAQQVVTGWAGITRNHLLDDGSTDALEFSPDLWAAAVADKMHWVGAVNRKVSELVQAHMQAREAAEKN